MSLGEFDIIARYFTRTSRRSDVLLGVGDDAAVLAVPADRRLVAAVDTIVEDIHFPAQTSAYDIGYRALAVNLSDLAAMGAVPAWMTLALSLPKADQTWLEGFAAGLFHLADTYGVDLVGGDTVRGPLVITVQIMGLVENDGWLTRSGGRPGDMVFVSGSPGEAAAGLALIQSGQVADSSAADTRLLQRFYRPEPRVALGRILRRLASAAMDVSDGLLTDLSKLCAASGCGARLDLESLPVSSELRARFDISLCERFVLTGGDDYELLFTIAPEHLLDLEAAVAQSVRCTPIGRLVEGEGVQCFRGGLAVALPAGGYDHFMSDAGDKR